MIWRRKSDQIHSLYLCIVVLGIFLTTVYASNEDSSTKIQARKLYSSPDVDVNFSNEELHKLVSMLEGKSQDKPPLDDDNNDGAFEESASFLLPELMQMQQSTTTASPANRVTTRRFYRRLRRKTTTTSTTEAPVTEKVAEVDKNVPNAGRQLTSGISPGELFQQLSLLNGILGALNSTAAAPTSTAAPEPTTNANSNATPVPDILSFLAGAKMAAAASSNSETIVPPPSQSPAQDDSAAALALLNLFSNGNKNKEISSNSGASSANLLNILGQSHVAQQPSASPSTSDADATAALTKLLLQSSANAPMAPVHGNSIVQPQTQMSNNAEASANQLQSLLGLLGTLGAAGQQPQSPGGINNLFNLGGDQVAQAQTNSLASLFGAQQPQQQSQSQNLLNLFGANQGNQGFSLASLLAPQSSTNSIPGLGLLSTVSSLGSSIFSGVSNIFGGANDGKPRVRGKGVDTRVGFGYRLGNVGDAQVVWDIGPQLFTDPLRNEMRPYTKKRESAHPEATNYFQSAQTTASEKEMQQIEAKRRMVQAAIQDHYRNNQFASVYPQPQPTQRRSSYFNFNGNTNSPAATDSTSSSSASNLLSYVPFGDRLRGFWTGLTSGLAATEDHQTSDYMSNFNFDSVKTDFGNNLMKRSSPDYSEYEKEAYQRQGREDDLDDPTHSTLTDYEKMLLQHGQDIGTAETKHGAITESEPEASESGFFSRWFKGFSSGFNKEPMTHTRPTQRTEWGSDDDDKLAPVRNPTNSPVKSKHFDSNTYRPSSPTSSSPYGYDLSFNRRNDLQSRITNNPHRRTNSRPQKRRSNNPFRNWFSSFRTSPQKPRRPSHSSSGNRRHFKRPSGNPNLQHFTNTNKDLMMADTNDDFIESAGPDSYAGFQQPLTYGYAQEFPDVPLISPPGRRRPTSQTPSTNVRASLSHTEKIVEPALLYDHLQVAEPNMEETDESFNNRNKVVNNPVLREREKQKVLGTSTPTKTSLSPARAKAQQLHLQKLRLNKLRNSTGVTGKQTIVVKNRGNTRHQVPTGHESISESSTVLPSVLSTISNIFSATTKPQLINSLLHNATSYLPSFRIVPRKKEKGDAAKMKTKLTLQNGRPSIVVPNSDDDEYDEDMETAGAQAPVVQVGHDMSFNDLQTFFGSQAKNHTKKRRFRIRVKENLLKTDTDKKDKDSKEDDVDPNGVKDIFVDIDSGEVSVLKPVASLVSFAPKKEENSAEESEVDYYEDDDGDGIPDADMQRKEHIFDAIQKQLVNNFEKMKKAQLKAEAKQRRKQQLAEQGMDESIDVVTKYFDLFEHPPAESKPKPQKVKPIGGLTS